MELTNLAGDPAVQAALWPLLDDETPDPRGLDRAVAPGRVRDVGVRLLQRCRNDQDHRTRIINEGLREASFLHSNERRLVNQRLWDDARFGRLVEAFVGNDLESVWVGLGVLRSGPLGGVDGADPSRAAGPLGLASLVASLRGMERGAAPPASVGPNFGLAANLSETGAAIVAEGLGDEALAFLRASNSRAPVVLRALGDADELIAALATRDIKARRSKWALDAVILEGWPNLGGLPEELLRYEVQDEGSQLLGSLVEARGTVIDWCAGAGGKTLQLARTAHRVIALDVRGNALLELDRRAAKAGLENVTTMKLSEHSAPQGLPREAHRVLVDAPCSGSGTWRRHPHQRIQLDPQRVKNRAKLQQGLLHDASAHVRVGGRLIYGTCSVLPSENEVIAETFLATHKAFRAVATSEILNPKIPGVGHYLRLAPHRTGTDGLFGAVFERVSA